MNRWTPVMKQLTLVSQMGISLVMPLLICLLLCSWMTNRLGVGGWVYVPGFILGLGSSGMTAYKFYKSIMKQEKKRKSTGTAFNQHL